MAFYGFLAVLGFIFFIISSILIIFSVILNFDFIHSRIKNHYYRGLAKYFRKHTSDFALVYAIAILSFIIGIWGAEATHDPLILQVAGMTFGDLISLVQEYLPLAIVGIIAFSAYLYRRIENLFGLIDNPQTGIHHRLTQIETKTTAIEKTVDETKNDVKELLKKK